jgi:hypothetical protein
MQNKRYINEFIKLKSAPDMLAQKLFPNVKEITESMGAYHAVRTIIQDTCNIKLNQNGVVVVCPGDGVRPRTAALFSYRSAWDAISIDPLLRGDITYNINRLTLYKKRMEDVELDLTSYLCTIIVLVHAHVKLPTVLQNIKAKTLHMVAIPCCVPQDIPNRPYIGYQDTGIWSERNTVKIWTNLK